MKYAQNKAKQRYVTYNLVDFLGPRDKQDQISHFLEDNVDVVDGDGLGQQEDFVAPGLARVFVQQLLEDQVAIIFRRSACIVEVLRIHHIASGIDEQHTVHRHVSYRQNLSPLTRNYCLAINKSDANLR
jgi:hypothetical protein